MTSFTPGPWFYRRSNEWSHTVVTKHGVLPDGTDNCWTVAEVNKQREPEHEANARLIAASPELYQALRDCVAALGGINSDNVPDTARAAIAKATS